MPSSAEYRHPADAILDDLRGDIKKAMDFNDCKVHGAVIVLTFEDSNGVSTYGNFLRLNRGVTPEKAAALFDQYQKAGKLFDKLEEKIIEHCPKGKELDTAEIRFRQKTNDLSKRQVWNNLTEPGCWRDAKPAPIPREDVNAWDDDDEE